MIYKLIAAFPALLAISAVSVQASDTRICAERDKIITQLQNKFGENRQSIGLGTNLHVMELFASPETGSWTITVTSPNGTTCLIASGQAFEKFAGEDLKAVDNDA